ncbi:MAG: VCBS repeat-containing protein [Bryobacterales bacterium]|nr:VCBS repeat-containing protein [Bryobacterales bacterium]
MSKLLLAIGAATLACSAAAVVEQRQPGDTSWLTANRFRLAQSGGVPAGQPVWVDADLALDFQRDSVRVFGTQNARRPLAAKTDWRRPRARISWISDGSPEYRVYFDVGRAGETERLVEPAMMGAGDRITYGRAGVRGKLAVGLWAHPAPIDMDGDGNLDMIVSCPDRPSNGIWYFRNLATNAAPLYDRAEWLGPGKRDLVAADFNGDGRTDLVFGPTNGEPGGYYNDPATHRLTQRVNIELPRGYHIGRDDLWQPVDWDRDGRIDVLAGVSDWTEYGWDDAYDATGKWTRGPLHGYVYFHRNTGTNAAPRYAPPVKLTAAGGAPIDRYGSPIPNPVDWFGTGRLDLIVSNFIDTVAIHRNGPGGQLSASEPLRAGGKPIRMDLCMIQPRVVRWHPDGRPSLLVGEEDGTVSLFENAAPKGQTPQLAAPRVLQQVDPFVKSGALSRPVAFDWNGDGLLDIVAGNSAGYLQYFENTGTVAAPAFTDRGYLEAGGHIIRRIAGPNGSVQGPAEEKWGYSNPSVADWDLDGLPDILVNDIWGDVVWYRNTGTRRAPMLAAAAPIEVEWPARAPKPDWVWWEPKPKQLLTQWRTTPKVVDWNRDGLPDLVMLNHQGYLSLFRRERRHGALVLLPPERIFVTEGGRFLLLAAGRAGSSGRRKVELADWDSDGDLDLITDADGGPVWYENVGTQARPIMRQRGKLIRNATLAGHSPTPNVADWNADGRLDLIIGAEDGLFYYFERSFIERSDAPQ